MILVLNLTLLHQFVMPSDTKSRILVCHFFQTLKVPHFQLAVNRKMYLLRNHLLQDYISL